MLETYCELEQRIHPMVAAGKQGEGEESREEREKTPKSIRLYKPLLKSKK